MNAEGLTREECSFLRGAAALFVVVAHYCQWYGAQTDAGILCILLSKLGRYGVSIFFALSGKAFHSGKNGNILELYA